MILKTSTTPMGGLSGRRTNAGVKKTLIHRRDQPACYGVSPIVSLSLSEEQSSRMVTHRNINHRHHPPRPMTPQQPLRQQQAGKEQQEAGHRRREGDVEVAEEGVHGEAGGEEDEEAAGDEEP